MAARSVNLQVSTEAASRSCHPTQLRLHAVPNAEARSFHAVCVNAPRVPLGTVPVSYTPRPWEPTMHGISDDLLALAATTAARHPLPMRLAADVNDKSSRHRHTSDSCESGLYELVRRI